MIDHNDSASASAAALMRRHRQYRQVPRQLATAGPRAGIAEPGLTAHSPKVAQLPLGTPAPAADVRNGGNSTTDESDRFAGLSVSTLNATERESVLKLARNVLATEVANRPLIAGQRVASRHVQMQAARYDREVFGCLFLTARHQLIAEEELFFGSIDRTAVYPRVVLQKVLEHNAASVILWHNHPSAVAEPSPSDIQLTTRLQKLLEEIDVHLVDHIVVSRTETVSMAARGLI